VPLGHDVIRSPPPFRRPRALSLSRKPGGGSIFQCHFPWGGHRAGDSTTRPTCSDFKISQPLGGSCQYLWSNALLRDTQHCRSGLARAFLRRLAETVREQQRFYGCLIIATRMCCRCRPRFRTIDFSLPNPCRQLSYPRGSGRRANMTLKQSLRRAWRCDRSVAWREMLGCGRRAVLGRRND
jgi:hypothetical protein